MAGLTSGAVFPQLDALDKTAQPGEPVMDTRQDAFSHIRSRKALRNQCAAYLSGRAKEAPVAQPEPGWVDEVLIAGAVEDVYLRLGARDAPQACRWHHRHALAS